MYNADTLKKMVNEVAVTEKEIQELRDAVSEARNSIDAKQDELLELESRKHLLEHEVRLADQTSREQAGKINWLSRKVQKLNADLKQDAHAKAVAALFKEQPDFFEVLKDRYEVRMKELNSGLEKLSSFIDSRKFCEKMKQMMDSQTFSPSIIEMRDAKKQYESLIKEFCEMKINKQIVSANAQHQRFQILDRLIFMREVEAIWNTQ
jgi:chromosome segregation ATPase